MFKYSCKRFVFLGLIVVLCCSVESLASNSIEKIDSTNIGLKSIQFMLGYGEPKNIQKATKLAKQAMENGDIYGSYCFAFLTWSKQVDFPSKINPIKTFSDLSEEITTLSKNGVTVAQDIYGTMLYLGLGVNKNVQAAENTWLNSAEKGYAPSMNHLGVLYRFLKNSTNNLKKSIYWYEKAANLGYAPAQDDLGYLYYKGEGVKKDLDIAHKWFLAAAQQGEAEAQYNIGYLYKEGYGGQNRIEQMLKWFKKADEQNYFPATHALAELYYEGKLVDKDNHFAVSYLEKASAGGYSLSQNTLGLMYLNGEYLKENPEKAYELFQASAKQGNKNAVKNIEKMHELGMLKKN